MAGRALRLVLFLVLVVLPALLGLLLFGYLTGLDIGRLVEARDALGRLVSSDGNPIAVYAASAFETIHRVNAFADGTWTLLCAMILGIGAHGLLGWKAPRDRAASAVLWRAAGFSLLLVLPGLAGMGLFGRVAITDYHELIGAYERFQTVARAADPTLESVIVANAIQHGHRLNVFATGTWSLLCAIVATLGIHGLLGLWREETWPDRDL